VTQASTERRDKYRGVFVKVINEKNEKRKGKKERAERERIEKILLRFELRAEKRR